MCQGLTSTVSRLKRSVSMSEILYPGYVGSQNIHRRLSSSSRASSFGGFSDADSEESLESPFSSSPRREWNLPSYDLPAHQRILRELVDFTVFCAFPSLNSSFKDLTGQVTKLDTYPFDSGSAADIYHGIIHAGPLPVTNTMCITPYLRIHYFAGCSKSFPANAF
jgi:hypothetical protein